MTLKNDITGFERLHLEAKQRRDEAQKHLDGTIGVFANVVSAAVLRHLRDLNKHWLDIRVEPGVIDIGKAIFYQGTVKVPQYFTRRDHAAFLLDPAVIEIKVIYAEFFRITNHSLNPVSLKWSYVQAVEEMPLRLSEKA